mgnify:CR=1 FL=1
MVKIVPGWLYSKEVPKGVIIYDEAEYYRMLEEDWYDHPDKVGNKEKSGKTNITISAHNHVDDKLDPLCQPRRKYNKRKSKKKKS